MEAFNCEATSFNAALDSQHVFLESMLNVESNLHKEQQVQIHNSAKKKTQDQKKHQKTKITNEERGNKARIKTMQNKLQTNQQKREATAKKNRRRK